MAPSDAHGGSRQSVGSPLLSESARVWMSHRLDEVLQDLRYGFRGLRRTPGVTFVAILMLAFGIGANTAIFSMVNALLLRPMPVVDPDRLIRISQGQDAVISLPVFRQVTSETSTLRAVAATVPMQSDLDVDGDSHFAAPEFVTANYADVVGFRVSLGRWFVDDREPAAVISDAVWERQFARSPHVLGRVIRSGTDAYTVVGVAPHEFSGVRAPMRTDFWAPIETRFHATTELEWRRIAPMMTLFGRLRPRATAPVAAAELNGLDTQAGGTAATAPSPSSTPITAEVVRALPSARNQRLVRLLMTSWSP